jgi:hypothetical protein
MSNENNELFKKQVKLLDRIKDAVGLTAGTSGFKRYTTGTYTNLTWHALVVQEDTVFTEFSVGGVSYLAKNGMSGVTFKQGAYLPGAGWITGFTISSGSVIAY